MRRIRRILNASAENELTSDDKQFIEDVETAIVDENGVQVELDKLKVVKNLDDNTVALFMPTDDTPNPPEHYEVIGSVIPNTEDNINSDIFNDGEPIPDAPGMDEFEGPPMGGSGLGMDEGSDMGSEPEGFFEDDEEETEEGFEEPNPFEEDMFNDDFGIETNLVKPWLKSKK